MGLKSVWNISPFPYSGAHLVRMPCGDMIHVHKMGSREGCKAFGALFKKVQAQAFATAFPHQGRQV